MMKHTLLAAFAVLASPAAVAGKDPPLSISADVIRGDNFSGSLMASGHVTAVRAPFRMVSEAVSCDSNQVYRFASPTAFTTCTNDLGRLHWHVSGDMEFQDGRYARLRDGWVHFWEIPVLWIPYLYTPLHAEEGLRIMPGYIGRWGAFLMTKYVYHIAGTRASEEPEGWGLDGNTRFDLRYRQGIAFGESLKWRTGEYGHGHFKVYYAYDRETGDNNYGDGRHSLHWGSEIPVDRYAVELAHDWQASERDRIWVRGAIFSDSYFRSDFMRNTALMLRNQFLGYNSNQLAWEHLENGAGIGAVVSGPLNDFVGGTARLPEIYFDVNPLPLFGSPVNYETQNRFGFLRRTPAYYGRDGDLPSVYNRNPGVWSEYETCRIDTYHRLTLPLKYDDLLSVVPRLAYRGTYWGDAGNTCPTGSEFSENTDKNVFRSILEGGVAFSARGSAEIADGWRHLVEPYLDILAQKAWYSGLGDGSRPYVFDALDASLDWSDQFASRGRNLPYTWYGLTPGVRNAFDAVDDDGRVRRVFDIDTYVALQCNDTSWTGDDDSHRLAEVGEPNYGKRTVTPVPGFRLRWFPTAEATLGGHLEYDADNNAVARSGVSWRHSVARGFGYYVKFNQADFRRWDFASCAYGKSMRSDEMNYLRYSFATVGFTHELCDAIEWSPFMRWDCREGQLDVVGGWIDYRTDCLGFRLLVEHRSEYTLIDGTRYEEDFSVGFFIYLRAFGADASNLFQQ